MERVWNQIEHFSHVGRRGLGTLFEVTQQAFLAATLGALLVFAPLQGQAQKDPASQAAPELANLKADNVLWLHQAPLQEISSGRPGNVSTDTARVR